MSHQVALTLAELKQRFREIDTDGNGVITMDEAHKILQQELGYTLDQTRRLMHVYDRNRDGRLSYEEFVQFYFKIKEKESDLEKAFHEMDKDGNGHITMDEAQVGLRDLGLSPNEIHDLFNLHDINGDGKLQFDEFKSFWSA